MRLRQIRINNFIDKMPSFNSNYFLCCLISLFISFSNSYAYIDDAASFKIASWNLDNFSGASFDGWKYKDNKCVNHVCQGYSDVITKGDYDIIFVQGIKSHKEGFSAFDDLCSNYLFNKGYGCDSIATGENNEGYGFIYKKNKFPHNALELAQIDQGNGPGEMHRPPLEYKFTFYTKPKKYVTFLVNNIKAEVKTVERELNSLEDYTDKTLFKQNVVILGDLNTDCSYYNPYENITNFIKENGWDNLIPNGSVTNIPNAATTHDENRRGCAYNRIIASRTLQDNYNSEKTGLVGKIPYDIPLESDKIIPKGTHFKDIAWNGEYGNDVYGLSDRKLTWLELTFGGIGSFGKNGKARQYFEEKTGIMCNIMDPIYLKGKNFQPNLKNKTVYIVKNYSDGEDLIEESKTIINTDQNGDIIKSGSQLVPLWSAPQVGKYNIIIDINLDGKYNANIDIIDNDEGVGFEVLPCQTLKQDVLGVSTAIINSAVLFFNTIY